MKEVILFGECLGDPLTIRILALLRPGELCACEIIGVLGEDRGKVQNRLRKLRQSGVVRARQRGSWLAFRIHTKYADLVETIFEAFEESVGWDPVLSSDGKNLSVELRKRVDDWCANPRANKNRTSDGVIDFGLRVEEGGTDDSAPTARRRGLRPTALKRLARIRLNANKSA